MLKGVVRTCVRSRSLTSRQNRAYRATSPFFLTPRVPRSRVVKLLKQSDKFEPVAMVREEAQRKRFDEMGVEAVVGDIAEHGAPSAQQMSGLDAVIFAAGAGRHRGPLKQVLVDYAGAIRSVVAAQESESVSRFILLSGINSDVKGTRRSEHSSDFDGPLAAWHRLKAHSEIYLQESGVYGRALNWTILCPGRLLDDPEKDGTGLVKLSLIHGEDDLKTALTPQEREAAIRHLPGSHDGKVERLCVSRDNVAATLVGLLEAPNTANKSITLVDGIVPVQEALSSI